MKPLYVFVSSFRLPAFVLFAAFLLAACGRVPALVWEGPQEHPAGVRCLSLRLHEDARAAVGDCDGPHAVLPLLEHRRREWDDLRARFAPFTYEQAGERLVFGGTGAEEATTAWQRALSAWAGLARLETEAGRSGASIGTAFVWQREAADRPGYCDFLTVELYGHAAATRARCGGGDGVNLGRGWLETDGWTAFDAWYHRYGVGETTRPGTTLRFFGRGETPMPEDEAARLDAWAEAAFVHLTQP